MRRNAKVDSNQKEIVTALRKYGATVLITSQLKNCFDILTGFNGINYIMEIKDGTLPPSKKRLTEGEDKFCKSWKGGKYYIVESIEQAIAIISK
jgi:RNase P/RNase MRP subunit p30